MKCNYCDYEIKSDAVYCPNCGEDPKTTKKNLIKEQVKTEDKSKARVNAVNYEDVYPVWGVLGFFIPLVGVILFFVWINTKPKCSKAAGLGALIRIVMNIGIMILFGIFSVIFNK